MRRSRNWAAGTDWEIAGKQTHADDLGVYKMGGLITLMPFTFVSVLVGIIAMSGVPPLSGFGGRWLFYNGIMASDMRLPMVLIFMSGPIGFLCVQRDIRSYSKDTALA